MTYRQDEHGFDLTDDDRWDNSNEEDRDCFDEVVEGERKREKGEERRSASISKQARKETRSEAHTIDK